LSTSCLPHRRCGQQTHTSDYMTSVLYSPRRISVTTLPIPLTPLYTTGQGLHVPVQISNTERFPNYRPRAWQISFHFNIPISSIINRPWIRRSRDSSWHCFI